MTKTKKKNLASMQFRLRVAAALTGVLVLLTVSDAILDPPPQKELVGALTALAIAWGGLGADYIKNLFS
jgi:hypothetical protein